VLICVQTPELAASLRDLPAGAEVISWDGTKPVPPRAAEVDFLIAPYPASITPAELIAALPNLKVVQLLSAGVNDWVDAVPPSVTLCRGVGLHVSSTADLALALTLASIRQIPRFLDQQRRQVWQSKVTDGLDSKRVLIIGAGEIGQAIGRRIVACDASVTFVGRSARDGVHGTSELPDLLPRHDVVILVVPLTAETLGLVDAQFLAAMPDNALLVNVARGGVVLTDALVAELAAGRLHAALDVTDPEPLPEGHPLWTSPNTVLTPHIGGGTKGWRQRGLQLVAEQLQRYATGEALHYVVTGSY
jgi:phosphoglycerate dehydrogenase-like enzyme